MTSSLQKKNTKISEEIILTLFMYVLKQSFNNNFFFSHSKNINEEIRLNVLIRLSFLIFGRVLKINRYIRK